MAKAGLLTSSASKLLKLNSSMTGLSVIIKPLNLDSLVSHTAKTLFSERTAISAFWCSGSWLFLSNKQFG